MKEFTLLTFGAYTLTGSPNLFTEYEQGVFSHDSDVISINNARSNGSTVVSSELAEKDISLPCSIVSDDAREMRDVFNEVNLELARGSNYIRHIPVWDDLANITTATDWIASGDTANVEYTQTKRLFDGAIQFDMVVSAGNSTIYNENNTGTDIQAYNNGGNTEVSIYIPDVTDVSSVEIRVGSSASDYLSYTFTQQFDNQVLKNGYNLFSVPLSAMATTGAVDYGIYGRYTYVKINYPTSKTSVTGVVLASIIWQCDSATKNFYCYSKGISVGKDRGNESIKQCTIGFLNSTGIAESSTLNAVYTASSLTGASNTFYVTFEGSYTPKPTISILFNTITGLGTSFTITNQTNGDSVVLSQTWAINDLLVIDFKNDTVTKNGAKISYSDVLPRFELGLNKILIQATGTTPTVISQTTNNADLKGEI